MFDKLKDACVVYIIYICINNQDLILKSINQNETIETFAVDRLPCTRFFLYNNIQTQIFETNCEHDSICIYLYL